MTSPMRLLLALALAFVLVPAGAARAAADRVTTDRALALVGLPYERFAVAAALAPRPFDWTTDGCSRTPPAWARLFTGPCRQHDFAYRNLGHGLRLSPLEATRVSVDARLRAESMRVCASLVTALRRQGCRVAADVMWLAVRLANPRWG